MSDAPFIDQWHDVVLNRNFPVLQNLLHDDVKFHSPAFWKPKEGRQMATAILSTVINVFQDFTYHREVNQGNTWVLEFSAAVDGKNLKGVDIIQLDDNGKIIDFEVMVRPANALIALGEEMSRRLSAPA